MIHKTYVRKLNLKYKHHSDICMTFCFNPQFSIFTVHQSLGKSLKIQLDLLLCSLPHRVNWGWGLGMNSFFSSLVILIAAPIETTGFDITGWLETLSPLGGSVAPCVLMALLSSQNSVLSLFLFFFFLFLFLVLFLLQYVSSVLICNLLNGELPSKMEMFFFLCLQGVGKIRKKEIVSDCQTYGFLSLFLIYFPYNFSVVDKDQVQYKILQARNLTVHSLKLLDFPPVFVLLDTSSQMLGKP